MKIRVHISTKRASSMDKPAKKWGFKELYGNNDAKEQNYGSPQGTGARKFGKISTHFFGSPVFCYLFFLV